MSIPLPQPKWGTFKEDFIEFRISQGQLRARDLEVARVVLEAAAKECDDNWGGRSSMSAAIRALEFKHE